MKKNTLSDRLFVTALTKYIVYTKPWILCLGQSHTHTHTTLTHTHTQGKNKCYSMYRWDYREV
jgi:hypothetical protein